MSDTMRELLVTGAGEQGIQLSETNVRGFLFLMGELRKWNRNVNLTAIVDERGVVVKHFLDSLTVVPHIPHGARLLDLGSGGGFPAIPLAIVRPDLIMTSVDATLKKIHFQRHAARLLGLSRFTALHARGEALAQSHAGQFDVILSRAFSSLPDFVSLAHPLLAPGGVIIAMKGKGGEEEAAAAERSLEERGLVIRQSVHLLLPGTGDERTLLLIVTR